MSRKNRNRPRGYNAMQGQRPTETRRLAADDRARARPLPNSQTKAGQQAANAARLQAQSAASNVGRRRRFDQYGNEIRPGMGLTGLTGVATQASTDAAGDPGTPLTQAGIPGIPLPRHPGIIPDDLQAQMMTNMAPQAQQSVDFAPGSPLPTTDGIVPQLGPRGYEYPVGYNISALPRSTEGTSFAQLRNLANLYSGIQICQTVWFDVISRLAPYVTWEDNLIPDGESESDPKWRDVTMPAEEWLQFPDGYQPFTDWMTASVRDVLELGQSPIYFQRNLMGEVVALQLVDAATIKPLLDERGSQPLPPWPAYQQFVWGIPAGKYRSDEIYMIRETSRSDAPYPFSRVERVIMIVNMALRKQNLDLARFTHGAIPEGFIFPTENINWTPEQLEKYEQRFNGLFAGNEQRRAGVKMGPPGATFVPSRVSDPMTAFDDFLLNITVAAHGLTMDEIAMTADSNRSVGSTQQAVIYRRVVEPMAMRYAAFLTRVIKEKFDRRLLVKFKGYEEEEDQLVKAQTLEIGVKNGALAVSRMAKMMGWPVDVEVPPMLITASGPIFLEDALTLRQAQTDAKLAGLEFAMQAPGGMTPGAPEGQGQDGEASGGSSGDGKQGDGKQGDKQKPGQQPPPAKNTPPAKPGQKPAVPANAGQHRAVIADMATRAAIAIEGADDEARRADYRRWRIVADRAVKAGKRVPHFQTAAIPLEDYALLSADLARCTTIEQVRIAFERARAREQEQPINFKAQAIPEAAKQRLTHRQSGRKQAAQTLSLHAQHIFDLAARQGHAAMG